MKQVRHLVNWAALGVVAVTLISTPSFAAKQNKKTAVKVEQQQKPQAAKKGKAVVLDKAQAKSKAPALQKLARVSKNGKVLSAKAAKGDKAAKASKSEQVTTNARLSKAQKKALLALNARATARSLRAARPEQTQVERVAAQTTTRVQVPAAASYAEESAAPVHAETRNARMNNALARARVATGLAPAAAAAQNLAVKPSYALPAGEANVSAAPASVQNSYDSSASLLDALGLDASAAIVVDQDSREILARKNERMQLPMASVTKMMTAVVMRDAGQSLDELITIQARDLASIRGSRSRLRIGDTLSRGELMQLMLMSSENLAAHTLANNYPGGMDAFVVEMRLKAKMLGMMDTNFADASGLSSSNRSTARDLAILLDYASKDARIRQFSTWPGKDVFVDGRYLEYRNTNALVHNPEWSIGIQKTGYISAAGYCLIMQTNVAGRNVLMVFLDAANKKQRLANAVRVRDWVMSQTGGSRNFYNVGSRGGNALAAPVQP